MNLLFILTGGGRLNYVGTKAWLRNMDLRIKDKIDFVLCLDRLATAEQLYLHVSKLPKTNEISQIYNTFTTVAQQMNIPFEVMHKKINISRSITNWQHESFAKKRLLSFTLSSQASPAPLFAASTVMDRLSHVKLDILTRNIRFVATVLAQHIYATNQTTMLKGSSDVNVHFVREWMEYVDRTPRVAPYMDKTDAFFTRVEKHFSSFTSDSKKSAFPLDSTGYRFWGDKAMLGKPAFQVDLNIYRTKPLSFELYITAAIAVYLSFLYLFCTTVTRRL